MEIIKMERIEKIKQNLLEIKSRLVQQVNSELSTFKPVDELDSDDDIIMQLAQLNGHSVKSIDEALSRIDKGGYGVCDGCEKHIPIARLEVIPWTNRCLKCQERVEYRQGRSDQEGHWAKIRDDDEE